ncbi:MAG: TVP38/TMEM64 family protein [Coriobacteriales bacterium]|jgi:uncharacterized membrane protein YdjX (TVP38/TMEM64 family)|nr:TVP38/TMEM64 family protein [Coriobacteriales bacterium]
METTPPQKGSEGASPKGAPSEDALRNSSQGTSPDTSPDAPPPKRKISNADKAKFAGLLLFIALMVTIGVLLVPYYEHLTTEEGRLQLIEEIKGAGIAGVGICLGLQFVQIVVAFIPGEVTQLAIGAIYGPLLGSLITALGALISSLFIFFVVRKLGGPFVQGMIGTKNSKVLDFLHKDRNLNAITFILFLIPGLPKDVFTYLFPLTTIRPLNFFVLSTLGRIPGIVASAYIGSAAVQGDYTQAIIVGVIAGGLGLLGIIFNKRIIAFVDKVESHFKRSRTRQNTD